MIIKKEAFGFGDSKYLFMIATWLGLNGALSTLILSIYINLKLSLQNISYFKIIKIQYDCFTR